MKDEQPTEDLEQLIDGSRRSFMKKSVIASGALAFGVGSGAAAAESDVVQPSQTLMFAYDYIPGRSLQVISRLQQAVTRSILGQETSDGGTIVNDTTEWNTHVAQYQVEGDGNGEYILVFTRNGQVSDQLQLGMSATFFNDEFNLLEVTVGGDGGDGG